MAAQSGVYEIVNTVNGKRYIGSAKNFKTRWSSHRHLLAAGRHHSRHLQAAWVKHGETAFKFLPILTCAPTKQMLLFYEQQLLDKAKPEYNIARVAGSTWGVIPSEAARKKMSVAGKGKPKSQAHCEAIGIGQRGRKMSEKAKSALLAVHTGRALTDEHKEKLRALNLGKVMPSEAIEKSASARRGRKLGPQSPELIEKRAAALRGKKQTPEAIANRTAAVQRTKALKRAAQAGAI